MFSRAELIRAHEEAVSEISVLRPEVDQVLRQYASDRRYLYSSRVKSLDSYLQKLETGRFTSADLEDLFACTLVVPRLPDIDECIKDLPRAIRPRSKRGPGYKQKEPDVFRFDDWQLTCQMVAPAGSTGPSPYDRDFELQVRTLTQYAWSEATHDLVYKGGVFDWKRARLSAQLRALAEQADLLFAEFLSVSKTVPASRSHRSGELARIGGRVNEWMQDGLVSEEFRPASVGRLAECVVSLCEALGNDADKLSARVETYIRSGYPGSLSVYQVFLGEALTGRPEPVDWAQTPRGFALLVTSELEDFFPETRNVPSDRRVSLKSRYRLPPGGFGASARVMTGRSGTDE